ncbi:MAG: bifunctional lysylphosphatidylglycerol flippase/synthetase MprF [Proteocatella sp.]
MNFNKVDKIKNILTRFIIPLIVMIVVFIEGKSILTEIDIGKIEHTISSISPTLLIGLFLFSIIAILSITLYDIAIVRKLGYNMKTSKIMEISLISATFNNVMGMGGIIGAGLRSLFLKDQNFKNEDIVQYNLILVPSTMIGLSIFMILGLTDIINLDIIFNHYSALRFAAIGFIIFLLFYLFFDKFKFSKKNEPKFNFNLDFNFNFKFKMIMISVLEWLLAGLLFCGITMIFNSQIKITDVLGIFSVSLVAAILSLTPGGIGSFDFLVVLGLKEIGISSNDAFSILILFRVMYYIIPWFFGATLSVIYLSSKFRGKIKSTFEETYNTLRTFSYISKFTLYILIMLSGIILLMHSIQPEISQISIIQKFFSGVFENLSLSIEMVLGIILIIIASDIKNGVKYAYKWVVFLLFLGAISITILQLNMFYALILTLVATLLIISKDAFDRETYPYKAINIIGFLIFTFISLFIYQIILKSKGMVMASISENIIYFINNPSEYFSQSLPAFIMIWGIIFLYIKFRPKFSISEKPDESDFEEIKLFLKKYNGNAFTHLIFTGDKNIFWNSKKTVLFSYAKTFNRIVVLGDPIGEEKDFSEAISEIQNYFEKYGYGVVFYEVDEKFLSIYHDNGYSFFKLGEEGVINLDEFKMSSNMRRNYNKAMNLFEEGGYKLEILEPPFDYKVLIDLKTVSEEWLAGRKEKGFSIGFFSKEYIQRASVYVLRDKENKIVAFMSLRPYYDENKNISIDMMRYKKNSPSGTMDAMFIGMINWAKENNYERFIIGMAPLSNVGFNKFSRGEEKLAYILYKYGKSIYGFVGLRAYKEKFKPEWEPKYLCYDNLVSLPKIWLETAMLISESEK